MWSANAGKYARALLVGTARDQLAKPEEPKRVKGLSAEEIARMEREMESLERDFRIFQDQFGQNTLHLGAAQRYLRRLLDNTKVKRFLQQRHPEILEELNDIAALESPRTFIRSTVPQFNGLAPTRRNVQSRKANMGTRLPAWWNLFLVVRMFLQRHATACCRIPSSESPTPELATRSPPSRSLAAVGGQ